MKTLPFDRLRVTRRAPDALAGGARSLGRSAFNYE
jgi:hypothetical protein